MIRTLAALGVVCMLRLASAQAPAPDPLAEGRRLYLLADQELNLGHYEKALEHLESAYRLTSRPALLYNLGYVNRQLFSRTRKLDYLTHAIDLYRAFLDSLKSASDEKALANKARAEKELKAAEDDLAQEQAARTKGEESLELGERFLHEGRAAAAQEQLESYLRNPGNERPGVVRALMLKAAIAAAANDISAASDAYARALLLDRSVALPPKPSEAARRAFTQAQLKLGDTPVFTVAHTPPGSLKPGAIVDLVFTSGRDPIGVARGIVVRYRAGSGAFSPLPVQPLGRVSLPRSWSSTLLPGARVDYYGDVVDERGAILQHLGSPSLPFAVEVERPPAKPITRKWWFWTATVGVIAAAGLAIGLGVGLSEPPRPEIPIVTGLKVMR
jgi:tetratricopeptide (TPR) repeat protein